MTIHEHLVFLLFSVTKERTEVIYQGTYDDPSNRKAVWEEYEFKCKPGTIKRRPCLISPYHYRLDWLLWFSAFQVNIFTMLQMIFISSCFLLLFYVYFNPWKYNNYWICIGPDRTLFQTKKYWYFSFFLHKNMFWYSLEGPHGEASKDYYPQCMFHG